MDIASVLVVVVDGAVSERNVDKLLLKNFSHLQKLNCELDKPGENIINSSSLFLTFSIVSGKPHTIKYQFERGNTYGFLYSQSAIVEPFQQESP